MLRRRPICATLVAGRICLSDWNGGQQNRLSSGSFPSRRGVKTLKVCQTFRVWRSSDAERVSQTPLAFLNAPHLRMLTPHLSRATSNISYAMWKIPVLKSDKRFVPEKRDWIMTGPRRLDEYEIFTEIGHGGFATIYKARDTTLDCIVALKVLSPTLLTTPGSPSKRLRCRGTGGAGRRGPAPAMWAGTALVKETCGPPAWSLSSVASCPPRYGMQSVTIAGSTTWPPSSGRLASWICASRDTQTC